jgi:hypothetical protein
MRRLSTLPAVRPLAALLAAVALVPAAAAAPPRAGVLVPGRSLGGIAIGASPRSVLRTWGADFGICRNCRRQTWYFTYAAFQPQGAGVEFRAGRVSAVFTLWSPPGWRARGVTIGDPVSEITTVFGPLDRRDCSGYYALLLPEGRAVAVFYVVGEKVWGLGLSRAGSQPCR